MLTENKSKPVITKKIFQFKVFQHKDNSLQGRALLMLEMSLDDSNWETIMAYSLVRAIWKMYVKTIQKSSYLKSFTIEVHCMYTENFYIDFKISNTDKKSPREAFVRNIMKCSKINMSEYQVYKATDKLIY